ncbi:MAG: thioredoxin family protein [Bacteroidetes bacterium]|nr:thioredoxin family protein [Bacteroidota bacterium]
MKSLLLYSICFIFPFFMHVQNSIIISVDSTTGSKIFRGTFSFDSLIKEPTFTWFNTGVSDYTPNNEMIQKLSPILNKCKLVVVMGTWCEDSHLLIPKLYKTLLACHFPFRELELIGVDREKQSVGNEREKFEIQLVPTIIVFKEGKELGRIVETIKTSIESDLLKLVVGH